MPFPIKARAIIISLFFPSCSPPASSSRRPKFITPTAPPSNSSCFQLRLLLALLPNLLAHASPGQTRSHASFPPRRLTMAAEMRLHRGQAPPKQLPPFQRLFWLPYHAIMPIGSTFLCFAPRFRWNIAVSASSRHRIHRHCQQHAPPRLCSNPSAAQVMVSLIMPTRTLLRPLECQCDRSDAMPTCQAPPRHHGCSRAQH